MILQLSPPIPLWHPASAQPVTAVLVIDYSPEHDVLLTVIRRDGQIWTYPTKDLRGQANETMERPMSPRHPLMDVLDMHGG